MQTIHLTIQEALQLACSMNPQVFNQPRLTLVGMYHTLVMALYGAGVSNHTIEHTTLDENIAAKAREAVLAQLNGQTRSSRGARITLMITHQECNSFSQINPQPAVA